jgi:peptide/nickel transport system substrate-binding protein
MVALSMLCMVLGACSPPAAPPTGGAVGQAAAAQPAPKVLTLGKLEEPLTIEGFTGGLTAGGAGEVRELVQNHLTTLDPNDTPVAQLSAELPSEGNGEWRVKDDGTMDVTWKLRPGVVWQDGAPFTSDDLLFSLTLHKDPDLPNQYGSVTRLMTSASAPDPLTFVVHWSSVYTRALEAVGLTPMPRHLMEERYHTDKDAFANSTLFTSEFIGLGPYRMVRWDRGSAMELTRFNGYWRGRPPLDRVIVRFIFDPTAMVANMLAGSVDLITPPSVDADAAVELKTRWEGTGNSVRIEPVPAIQYLELQLQPQYAKPANGLALLPVRQGMYQALDRPSYAAAISHGFAPAADSWYAPYTPVRKELEDAIPQYPYDPARSQQLLAQGSWTRGADGVLVHQPDSQRLEIELWSNAREGEKPAVVLAGDWKVAGADATVTIVPPARSQDREYLSKYPGVLLARLPIRNMVAKADSRLISSADNRWTGNNRSGYANARADQLADELARTIDPRRQIQLQREQVNVLIGDLAFFPLAWEVLPVMMLQSVKGDVRPSNSTWNVFEWTKE